MLINLLRYLEDFLPKLTYRPSGYKSSKKTKSDEDTPQQSLAVPGLDEDCQAAIRTIIRSNPFDYDVCTVPHCS